MPTSYPGGLDSYTTKNNADDLLAVNHPAAHNDLQDAVVAIETELGTNPSGPAVSVAAALAAAAAHEADTTGVHGIADTSLLLDTADIGVTVQAHSAVLDATTASFTTADETKLDGIEAGATADQTAAEILAALLTVDGSGSGLDADLLDGVSAAGFATAAHNHDGTYQPLDADLTAIAAANNGTILAATTASFLTADETKLDGIEAGATADQTAAEILAALLTVDGSGSGLDADLLDGVSSAGFATSGHNHDSAYQPLDADLTTIAAANNGAVLAATTASFLTADETKLDGIEAGADVTDAVNVEAAGALMDSEVDADIKTLALPANTTISAFGATLVDDADATAARVTLGVVIGTNVQAFDADLSTIAAANNGAVLAATTASFLTADETKLDGIEAGADVTDAANVETAIEAITFTAVAGAAGDEVMIVDATDGGLKAVLWENLPSGGGGLANVVEDLTPQLGGQLDVNGFALGDGTRELITFVEDAAAVNQIEIENNATGSGPILRAAGDDTNVDLNLSSKGTGVVAITGAVTVSSTVDGRDVSVDGTKLDGIEAGATADQTAAEILAALLTVDGPGSGLDADLLDGVSSAGFHQVGGTDVPVTDGGTGASDAATARTNLGVVNNATHTGDVTGDTALTIADNAVTNAKAADMATARIKGRVTAATGDPEDLTAAQVRTLINVEDGADVTDAANVETSIEAITFTAVAGAAGDEVMIVDATDGGLKAVLWENLPSGGGLANVVEDTTPQLGGMLDVNGFALGDGTRELVTFVEDAAAVNQLEIENNATGSGPILRAAGDDTNIALNLSSKGTGVVAITGAVTVSSTVDGRDVSVDGAKLDGIEAGATADQTAAEILAALLTVDGTGSGLDADLLDGISSAGFHQVGGTDVPITDGGTGASDAATARTNLGVVNNATHTGDVTGDVALTIANDAVTNAKLANVATATIKGRVTAATGDPEDLTGTQATTLLDVFTSGLKGLVPASGGGTTNFLRADGTFAAPPGGGGGLDHQQVMARVSLGF